MILVIEDKDNPEASIAVETDGPEGVELACIAPVAVRLEGDPPQIRLAFQIGRMGFEWRGAHRPAGPPSKEEAALLVARYVKALELSGSPDAARLRAKGASGPEQPAGFYAQG